MVGRGLGLEVDDEIGKRIGTYIPVTFSYIQTLDSDGTRVSKMGVRRGGAWGKREKV